MTEGAPAAVAVTVTVYVPAEVVDVELPDGELLLLQLETEKTMAAPIKMDRSILRRRAGIPMSRRDAKAKPPDMRQRVLGGLVLEILLDPVVVMETVTSTAEEPVTLSDAGTAQPGGKDPPVGPPLTLQVRLTVPVKPLCGTIETSEDPL